MVFEVCACILRQCLPVYLVTEQCLISDISIFLSLGVRSLTFTLFTLASF